MGTGRELVVGCPVSHREWILNKWFIYMEKAILAAGFDLDDVRFVFVMDLRDDEASLRVIEECTDPGDIDVTVVDYPAPERKDVRNWKPARYREMVPIRNALLEKVREIRPRYFLSCDSDILLHPDALVALIDTLTNDERDFGAVGGKLYMSEKGRSVPSFGMRGREGKLRRTDAGGVFPVDTIMALKLMSPAAYNVDYEFSMQGEDDGWSKAAQKAGIKLGWDGRVTSKHVWSPKHKGVVDERVGY